MRRNWRQKPSKRSTIVLACNFLSLRNYRNKYPMRSLLIPKSHIDMTKPSEEYGGFDGAKAAEIAKSIEHDGLLQKPVVRPMPNKPEYYEVIVGRHRVFAMGQLLKWDEIPCEVADGIDADRFESMQLAENIFRRNVTGVPLHKAIARWQVIYEKLHPDIKGAGKPSKSDESGEPQKAEPFVKKVADTLGISQSKAYRIAKTASALTTKQLDDLGKAKIGTTAIAKIAALDDKKQIAVAVKAACAGTAVEEAIRQGQAVAAPKPEPKVTKTGKPAASKDASEEKPEPKKDADLTDAEWLDKMCSRTMRALKSAGPYKADAILYRRTSKAIFVFRASIKKAMGEAKQKDGNGGFFSTMIRVLKGRHPAEWVVCSLCLGGRKNPEKPSDTCPGCAGGGYKLTLED